MDNDLTMIDLIKMWLRLIINVLIVLITCAVNPQRHIWWKESGLSFPVLRVLIFMMMKIPAPQAAIDDYDTTMTIGKHGKRKQWN